MLAHLLAMIVMALPTCHAYTPADCHVETAPDVWIGVVETRLAVTYVVVDHGEVSWQNYPAH